MARLYRPTITRYVDPSTGKRCSKDTPGAKRVKSKSKTWRGEFRDADGILRSEALCANKQAAQIMLAERIRQVQSGDPFHEHRSRPLAQHVADFETALIAKGGTEQHARQTAGRVRAIIDGCRFKYIRDVNASRVEAWLKDQRELDGTQVPTGKVITRYVDADNNRCRKSTPGARKIEEPKYRTFQFSIATSNGHLVAIKTFCNWLVKDRRAVDNPLAHLSRLNGKADVRIKRRSATPEELAGLIDAAYRSERSFRGLSGPDRAMLYRVAAGSGLRADELASLTPASFDLDGDAPTVTVEAAYSKRKRRDVQPIPSHLADLVRPWLAERAEDATGGSAVVLPLRRNRSDCGASGAVWPGSWQQRAADMVRADLEDAEIPFETDEGRFDFHSLRHSFISGLAAAGVHPKTAQELARHSDINLTMNAYTHLRLNDLSAAVDTIAAPARPEQRAKMVAGMVAGFSGNHSDSVRPIESPKGEKREATGGGFTPQIKANESDCESLKSIGAGGTRTLNQRIMSPLL